MPLDTRKCFWFGTEERAGWFATPLQGADSSPSAWGVDGTLLNGGGYAFNSFGSHKRYTYEWPQSSSPETAQMMKSYRDGTYGRGLLYFLEPGIYRTNILPAHWADPSMSINNEAPSLVYGVTPIGVPTSGGASLGLPVISAQYDLSNTPAQIAPTPDSSVFLPIPTGHTLLLGAFYSASGSAGVFATPVNKNGTLGTSVRLSEKSNSDDTVVTDQFSGDIWGVRLWVARSDSSSSVITLAGMCARLLETSSLPTYTAWTVTNTNLFPNPRPASLVGFTPTGSTLSLTADGVRIVSTSNTTSANVSRANWQGVGLRPPVSPGDTFEISADALSAESRTGSMSILFYDASNTYIAGSIRTSPSFANTPIAQRRTFQALAPANTVSAGFYFGNGGTINTGESVTFEHIRYGTPGGAYIDGSLAGDALTRYAWLGATDASASTEENRTATGSSTKLEAISAGPWIGGQGHSGCRFVGAPSYVNNGPVEGGRVGFAATFAEVGSWIYG